MLRFLLGKQRSEKMFEQIVEKTSKYLSEKMASIKPNNVEEIKLHTEQQKLEIEREKLRLEQQKLGIEREKLDAIFETAKMHARSRRYVGNLRAISATLTAGIVGGLTYLYFKPMEDELKEKKGELDSVKEDRKSKTLLFLGAQLDSECYRETLKHVEENFDFVKKPGAATNKTHDEFKRNRENACHHEKSRILGKLEYDGINGIPSTPKLDTVKHAEESFDFAKKLGAATNKTHDEFKRDRGNGIPSIPKLDTANVEATPKDAASASARPH